MARQQIEKAKAEQRAATRKENKEKKAENETGTRDGLRGVGVSVKKEEGGKRKRKGEAVGNGKRVKLEDEVSQS